jgi:transcription-repair coupling factor (superfamily II helicase)
MAMSGLRELSTIQTPPVDRLAVRTYVMEWDDMVMREALLREHHRGGQSFIVVPRIADMPEMEEWLRDHVPEVKVVTAHGQMAAGEVEERMSAFYEGKYDVLLSTTIVESGLDIPSPPTPSSSTAPTASALPSFTSCAGASGGRSCAPMPI